MESDERRTGREATPPGDDAVGAGDDDSFLHEELIPALLLVGLMLFLVPEPTTSALGVALLALGVGLWAYDLVR